jgi:5-methylcytosine-specific restriction protein A
MPSKPPIFRPAHLGTAQQGRQQYERERGSARERGYDVTWDKQARHFKNLNPLCLGCEAVGRVTATALVDHIIPHRGDPVLFADPLNRQPSCTPHHSIVKQVIEDLYARGKATAADLRLDSRLAIELTHRLLSS